MSKRVLFYSSIKHKDIFYTHKFYNTDIEIIKSIGHEVILSNSILDSLKFWNYDFFFGYFYRWSFFPALVAKIFGKKTFFTGGIDNLERTFATPRNYIIQKYFFKLCYVVANKCIVVSKNDEQNILQIYKKGANLKKITFSEHTIEMSSFLYPEKKEKIMTTIALMSTKDNVIRKGLDTSLRMFKFLLKDQHFSDYKFHIIGNQGLGSEYLRTIIKELNIEDKIIFSGLIEEDAKINLLKKSKFYFQLSKYEGFGIAALEAIAAKNIVIHSGKGGLATTIANKGILINIDKDLELQVDEVKRQIKNFNLSKLDEEINSLIYYYGNERRKKDFIRIFQ